MSETVVRDSTSRALTLALAVAFVCGLLVSVVAVSLRPIQRANVEAERIAQLELVLTALSGIGRAQSIESLEQRMVELDSGRFDDSIDGASFDAARAAASPTTSVSIPEEQDLAGLRRRAKHAQVYLVRGADERIDLIILPVSGRGYQSTLHAWLVMDGDTRTLRALKFYQHGETPGVLRIGVRSPGGGYSDDAAYQVDGISGATRTMQGVDGMLRFWLGEFGYAAFLQRVREERP